MTQDRTGANTRVFREQHSASFINRLAATAAAVSVGNYTRATILANQLRSEARQLHHNVIRDAVAGGLDWWHLSRALTMHPQAAYNTYAHLLNDIPTPAQQRPDLAVICTAGLAALHPTRSEYGIDLDNLDPAHSVTLDPTVMRLRGAAATLSERIWIAVTLTNSTSRGTADSPPPANPAVTRWTTVVQHPDERTWLQHALNQGH